MLLAGCGSNGSEQPPTLSDDSLYATFRDPGNEWRGKPFWSWNGRLEKDELIRQLHVFKEMGMGGAFLHSRVGLKTEYLGPEWCTDRLFRWSGLESLAGGAGVADGRACPDSGCEGTKLSGTCGCRIVRGALF